MARTDSLRRDHVGLVDLAKRLEKRCQDLSGDGAAAEARQILGDLSGKLKVHLAMEDMNLYPFLLASDDAQASQLAKQFAGEMGGIADAFKAYVSKWPVARAIAQDPSGFQSQTMSVLKVLAKRIEAEDTQLYPVADRIG